VAETRRAGESLREAAELRGRKGERLAAFYLMLKFYRVLGTRVRTHAGELDLVARALRAKFASSKSKRGLKPWRPRNPFCRVSARVLRGRLLFT
jgi:hypothetical protein